LKQKPDLPENLTKPAVIAGLLGAYRGLRMTYGDERRLRRTQREVRRLLTRGDQLWIELAGGGRKGSDGWLIMDMVPGSDFYWDLRRRLPFADDSVDKLYSSHFLEHLTFTQGQDFLKECAQRQTVSGGVLQRQAA
jgi:hypothetical protein